MKKKLSVLLCAAMVAASLAGCGGSSGAKTETTAAEASPAEKPSTDRAETAWAAFPEAETAPVSAGVSIPAEGCSAPTLSFISSTILWASLGPTPEALVSVL